MPPSSTYRPDPRHQRLPALTDPVRAAAFPRHILRFRNQRAAATVGLDTLDEAEWEAHFARFAPLPGNLETPLALRYHGHQFLSYNPNLGDGRGFLFGQLRDASGRLLDLGTKGSGRTMYARGGDGRLTLKGGFREILAAEVLEALGVRTCRIFSLFETGEALIRSDEPSPARGSVLVRLSHGHVRIGTFQRLDWEENRTAMQVLLEHCVSCYYPHLDGHPDLPAAFALAVMESLAETTGAWMAAGFVHGVLNSDNLNITGESFDYGPWRFLPHFDPSFTAAYFDAGGLYAYGRQPVAVHHGLSSLVESLGLIGEPASLARGLPRFEERVGHHLRAAMLRRLGLRGDAEIAAELMKAWIAWAEQRSTSFHRFFFDWYGGAASEARGRGGPAAAAYDNPSFAAVRRQLDRLEAIDPSRLSHPYFAGDDPCELRIDELEAAWAPVSQSDDWRAFAEKLAAIRQMGDALGLASRGEQQPEVPTVAG